MGYLPVILLVAVFIAAAVVIMHAGRDTTFYFDDWNFVVDRRAWRPHVLLYPHNEHLSLLPVLVYKILLELVGLGHYGVFRVVALAFNLTCGTLLFIYVRRRLGPWPALGFATVLVLMGGSGIDIIWPFQIGFLGSLAATLGALLMLDSQTRRGDMAACFLICVSLSSSSQGLMLLAAVIIEVLWRSDRVRRLWIPAIPLALYGLWYLKYGSGGSLDFGRGIPLIPDRIQGGLAGGASAATGTPDAWGGALALGLIGAFVYSLPRAGPRLPRLLLVAAMPLAFWALISVARSGLSSAEPRYLYPTGLYVVLLAAESLMIFAPRETAAVAIAVLLGLGALGRAPVLNSVGDTLRIQTTNAKAGVTAAELIPDRVPGNTRPDTNQPQLEFRRYQQAMAKYGGTIAWAPSEIPKRNPGERSSIDSSLIRLLNPSAEDAPGSAPAGCKSFKGDGTDKPTTTFATRLYVKAEAETVEVRLKRFGEALLEIPQMTVPAHTARVLVLPQDRSDKRWTGALRSQGNFEACQA